MGNIFFLSLFVCDVWLHDFPIIKNVHPDPRQDKHGFAIKKRVNGFVVESSSSNSALFSSTTIDDVLSHLNFLLLLFITSIFLIFTKLKSKTSTKSKPIQLPPGLAPWPLVRNLPHLLNNKPTFRWIHGFMKEMNNEIACIQLGNISSRSRDFPRD